MLCPTLTFTILPDEAFGQELLGQGISQLRYGYKKYIVIYNDRYLVVKHFDSPPREKDFSDDQCRKKNKSPMQRLAKSSPREHRKPIDDRFRFDHVGGDRIDRPRAGP